MLLTILKFFRKRSNIKIGDRVRIISFRGLPEGIVYDLSDHNVYNRWYEPYSTSNISYWVEFKLSSTIKKMEFSDFNLEKI